MKFANLFFTKKCNLMCHIAQDGYSCIAGCQMSSADRVAEPAVEDTVLWLARYAPEVPVHITGGEPCLRDDLVELIGRLLQSGHRVSLDTNGILLHRHPQLRELPLAYHVTWHRAQVTKTEFIKALDGFAASRMLISCVVPGNTDPPFDIKSELGVLGAWKYKWIRDREGYIGETASPRAGGPNHSMIFIGQGGEIFPCSKPYENYGSIYDLSFDAAKANAFCCPENRFPTRCYALRTAELMCELHETM